MAIQILPTPMYTGEPYVLYFRQFDEDSGLTADFSTWELSLVGREETTDSTAIFSFTEVNSSVFEFGTFNITNDDGVTQDYQMKVSIPASTTDGFRVLGLNHFHIGLLGTDPAGVKYQILPDARIKVIESVV